jgi:hypothetical protein
LLDHHHRLAAEAPGQDCGFDVALVLVAIADQQRCWVIDQREGNQQFGFAAGFEAEVPALAAFHQLFYHVALLVAFHREHPLVLAAVAVVLHGPLKGPM